MAETLPDKVRSLLLEWATEKSDDMRESLTKHRHVDYAGGGNLYQSATISPEWITDEQGGQAFHLKIVLPFYAEYLNDGTRPSAKNPSPAFINSLAGPSGWIAKKGIAVSLVKRNGGKFKNKAEANRSFAWSIATKRLRQGYQATHWFDEVWGDYPVPENSAAFKALRTKLLTLAGDASFFVSVIDPNKPDTL